MHPYFLILATAALGLFGLVPETVHATVETTPRYLETRQQPNATLARIADHYFQQSLELDPMYGSDVTGEARFLDRFVVTIAPAEMAKQKALYQHTLKALAQINPRHLSASDRMTHALLIRKLNLQLEDFKFPGHLLPIDHYGGMPTQFAQLATGQNIQPLLTVADYEAFLRRLSQLPAWNTQAIANMREGMARGIVQPRVLVERLLETLKPLVESDAEQHPFSQPVRNFPADFDASSRARLHAAYIAEIDGAQLPSLRALVRFLETEYLPNARSSAGLGALPGGAEWYRYRLRDATTTTMSARQIHQLGLSEVARIRREMTAIQAQYGDQGALSDFIRQHALKPEVRPFKTGQEVLDAYAALNRKIAAELPKLFAVLPKAALEIREEPEVSRATASDHYTGPSADGQRPGIFWAVIMNPAEYRTTEMTSLFLHEGQPGHHFHSARQQELAVPDFRKHDWITAYGEGWALYAETLGHEMGLYADPDAHLGHLQMELHRAIRLVTDTGLHALGWTREQTMRYMIEQEGVSEGDARRATERYMAWPGQATAYKIGALKIRELRDLAQRELGSRFSYATFHEQVLSDGCLPLDLLESKLKRWLKDERRAKPRSL